jgi:hypothetical protein
MSSDIVVLPATDAGVPK